MRTQNRSSFGTGVPVHVSFHASLGGIDGGPALIWPANEDGLNEVQTVRQDRSIDQSLGP